MLSEGSYLTAIYSYIGASVVILLYMVYWLRRHWRPGWVALTVLVLAALLLTPAHPNEAVTTYAPAFLVAIFETLMHGPQAAQLALKPLAAATGLALVLSILLRFIVFRRPATPDPEDPNPEKVA